MPGHSLRSWNRVLPIPLGILFVSSLAWSFARRPPIETLKIARVPIPSFGLVYLAESEGLFAKHGLDASFAEYKIGRDALKAVIGGEADLATTYQTPLVLKRLEGTSVRAISALHRSTRASASVARRDRGLASPSDLRGRKIAIVPGTSSQFFVWIFLTSYGIPATSVRIVSLDVTEITQAIEQGAVDAISIWEPYLHHAKRLLGKNAQVFYSDVYTEVSLLVGLEAILLKRRDACLRAIRALRDAEQLAKREPARLLSVLARFDPSMEEATLRDIVQSLDFSLSLDNLLLTTLEQEAETLLEQERFREAKFNARDVVMTRYLEEISPESVTLFERAHSPREAGR